MEDFETAYQLDQAAACPVNVPAELAFEEIIKNRTAPPCSLNDFMDYLVYVEHNAESLQFFLWYYDYIQRWSGLLPRQKALSPIWDPEKAHEPRSRFITYSHKRARSQKMNKIISIMEMEGDRHQPENPFEDPESRASFSSSRPRTPPSALLSPTESTKGDWQPFTIQPFRDEISRIVRQYISENSPRQLNLTPKDRDSCLRAAQHTTHPSALLPAFLVAEAALRSHSHPKFISWSTSNSTPARLLFLRALGVLLILLGLALDTALILSRQSHFLRILCLLLWWPGLTVLLAACSRLCIFLHVHGTRQLRPWELFSGNDTLLLPTEEDDNENERCLLNKKKHVRGSSSRSSTRSSSSSSSSSPSHSRNNHSISSFVGADPLRKPSLQTFGSRNDFADEPWVVLDKRRSVVSRIACATVPVQNTALRLLQDRTAFFAVLWGGLLASLLTVASLFVPAANLFL
ncbi:hypothetical protein QBC47DRAFT_30020 [Echria macrotheca]|uniref:RGS domain-containing protein n=1 Tax=Echria macrotheca TaxID=438768 RepID=A0AAJ0FAK2_9PEZI|nr:hypothetical protein QBC47DRAFT_30020 [Echria macrotheca]